MMDWAAFFTVHQGLPRQGPGLPEDVEWAVARAGLRGAVRVCDAGCGPGADVATLATCLPQAQVLGIEKHAGFVDEAAVHLAKFGDRVRVQEGDMAALEGPFDLIWCAGALYFLGVTAGLQAWRAALAPGGIVAFSEPVLLDDPDRAAAFWADYPAITDLDGIAARVRAAGFDVIDHRLILGAPWQAYYDPMQVRLDHLAARDPSPALAQVIADCRTEIANWRAAPDQVAYCLLLVAPQ